MTARSRVSGLAPTPELTGAGRTPGRTARPTVGRTARQTVGRTATRIVPFGAVTGSRRRMVLRVLGLLLAVPACYLVSPQIMEVFAAVPRIRGFHAAWFPLMVALEAGSFACVWHLLRIVAPGLSWSVAAYSHLTSNAVSRLFPGGGAVGNACHFRMLMVAGMEPTRAGSAVTASALLTGSLVFALPVFAVPAIALGQVPARLSVAVLYGAAVFAVLAGVCLVLARTDWAVRAVGRFAGWVLDRAGRPAPGLPALLLRRRNEVCSALGRRWRAATLAAAGRSTLDFCTLYVALSGTGQHPSPALVLVAYVAATVLTMIPITPGGLGFVEAGLVGTLVLAGVPAGSAALATLVYRLVSFWLPLPVGLPAWLAFRRRHGTLPPEPAVEPRPASPATSCRVE